MTAPASTHLWLVRHGQTDWNLEGRFQGQTDLPLNEAGWAQARALTVALPPVDYAAIYSSDLRRALDTAQMLGAHFNLPVQVDRRLREVGLGLWEGMLVGDIQKRYADEWLARTQDPLNARPPSGESLAELAVRAWAAATDITRSHPGGEVVVVAHGLTLAAIRVKALGLPLEVAYAQVPDNCRPERVAWHVTDEG
jgi:broad specificity phosphatase PhoE